MEIRPLKHLRLLALLLLLLPFSHKAKADLCADPATHAWVTCAASPSTSTLSASVLNVTGTTGSIANIFNVTDGTNWCTSASVGACWLQGHLSTTTATLGQSAGTFLTHSINGSGPTALGSFALVDSNSGNGFAGYHEAQLNNYTNVNGVGLEIDCKNKSHTNAVSNPQTINRGCKTLQVVASSQGVYGGTATNPAMVGIILGSNYNTTAILSGSITNASSALTPGTYTNVALTCVSGTCGSTTYGSYATATITVGGGGTVTTVDFTGNGNSTGANYAVNDVVSAAGSDIGGAGSTSTFQYTVASIGVSYQNGTFNAGIIFDENALSSTAYGYNAIEMGANHQISWWSANAPQFRIKSSSTTSGTDGVLNFADNSLNLLSAGSSNFTFKMTSVLASADTTGNYEQVQNAVAGSSPRITCTGPSDSNVGCAFATKGSGVLEFKAGVEVTGTTFTLSGGTGACSATSTLVGGAQAGSFLCTGTAGASAITITINGATGAVAAHGWACSASDITSGAPWGQSGSTSTTTCTISGTIATTSDKVVFHAMGY